MLQTQNKFLTLMLFVFATLTLNAQGLFESSTTGSDETDKPAISLGGYGRGVFYGGSKSFDYQSVFGEFALQGEVSAKHAFLFADLRFRGGLQYDSLGTVFQLKEAYAGYESDKFDIYLGEKIIKWGRTDGFNPTNNITPADYFFLTPEPDDQTLPNFLLQARWRITPQIELEAIGIPFYRPSVYRYELFDLGQTTSFTNPAFPEASFENTAVAGRLNVHLPAIGFSVSYFRGFSTMYGFDLKELIWGGIIPDIKLSAQTFLKNTTGFDFAIPAGSWVVRGELAYNHTTDYRDNMYIPNPGLSYVLALEHDFWGMTSILQYIGTYTFDFTSLTEPEPPSPGNNITMQDYITAMINKELTQFNRRIFYQQEVFNHALSLTLSRGFVHETLRAEIFSYYNFTSDEWFVRPALTWDITDRLQAALGGFYSKGPDKSLFFYSADVMNGIFFQLKVSF